MKKTIVFTSLLAGLALAGCNKSTRTTTASTDSTRDSSVASTTPSSTSTPSSASTSPTASSSIDTAANRVGAAADRTADSMRNAANSAGNAISSAANSAALSARSIEWKLSADDIKDDVAANRKIVRTKSGAPTGMTADKSTFKATVQSRLRADTELATVPIDVDVDRDGTVNLDGKANTIEQIAHAIAVALDTEGVTQVTSKIQLDKQGNARR
jgi:hyperosmotically inducible periplasmic protein